VIRVHDRILVVAGRGAGPGAQPADELVVPSADAVIHERA